MQRPALVDSTLDISSNIATLTFNRNDVRNALTGTRLIDDIVATVDWVNHTPNVSVLIFTGQGAAFSAGGNIKDMQSRSHDFSGDVQTLERTYREGIQRIPLALDTLEVPSIALVNGPAIGAGLDLTCMCDIRLASDKAKFGETFINLGIIPGDGGAWYLQKLIGYQKAAELTFTGRIIDAKEALDIGLVLEVLSASELLSRGQAFAQQIASKPPHAVRYTKRLMKKAQRMQLRDFLDVCAGFQGISHNTADHQEAVNAFIEKRAPHFAGK
ncbi:enoyl-CoA hydratase-related protein [Alkalimarinus coralli]|uniref:enoyl-CoA hydratase-related protein n=1 Tax=Alkalimarinus coralli TaxID=2935863 RepID=UPI00202B7458|nr:enoyl-CoA hydratase-related protein [Alkalimarinus coralli]